MKKRIIKKTILSSALLLICMVTLLVGTSLAWFNVTVVNEGNIIQSGDLTAEFMAADDALITTNTQDLAAVTTPIFSFDEYAQPGDSVTKYIRVKNVGTINMDYEVAFSAEDGGLGDAILIDVEGIDPVVAEQTYIGTAIVNQTFGGVDLVQNDYDIYKITMTYDSTVQPGTYEGTTFQMNLLLMAWQADYDDSKPVLVSTLLELQAAALNATKGQQIVVNANISDALATVSFTELINLNLGGNTLELDVFSVTTTDTGYMNFENGTLDVNTYTIDTPNAELNHAATFTVNAVSSTINTSGNSYVLKGLLSVDNLTLQGVTKLKPQTGSKMSVSGVLTAPSLSIVPVVGAEIIIEQADVTAIDNTAGADVLSDQIIVAEGEDIQVAIDAIDDMEVGYTGETIYVNSGTYVSATGIQITKKNITLKAIGEVHVKYSLNPTDPSPYNVIGISVLKDLGIITVDGFTVSGFETGIGQGMSNSVGTEFHVVNNTVYPGYKNDAAYMRNGIQVTGIGSSVMGNTVYGALLTADWAGTAIGVVNANNVVVSNNVITSDSSFDIGINVMNYNSAVPVNNVTIDNNEITNASNAIRISGSATAMLVEDIIISNNDIYAENEDTAWLYGLNVQTVTANNVTLIDNTIVLDNNYNLDVRISSTSGYATNVVINNTGFDKIAVVSEEVELKDMLSSTYTGDISNIMLAHDISLNSKLHMTRSDVTLDGNNNVLTAVVDFGTDNPSKHTVGIEANNIVIENIVIDAASLSYGLNTYVVMGIELNNVTINNSKGAALIVNGSTVVATDLYTSGNAWGAVNVDPGSGVTSPTVFTLNSGDLTEDGQIWSDGTYVTETATVTVTAIGYTEYYDSETGFTYWSNR